MGTQVFFTEGKERRGDAEGRIHSPSVGLCAERFRVERETGAGMPTVHEERRRGRCAGAGGRGRPRSMRRDGAPPSVCWWAGAPTVHGERRRPAVGLLVGGGAQIPWGETARPLCGCGWAGAPTVHGERRRGRCAGAGGRGRPQSMRRDGAAAVRVRVGGGAHSPWGETAPRRRFAGGRGHPRSVGSATGARRF